MQANDISLIQTLEVIGDDFTFATSLRVGNRKNYGYAVSCHWAPYKADTTMRINLTNTVFSIDQSVSYFNELLQSSSFNAFEYY